MNLPSTLSDPVALGAALRAARKRTGYSQQAVADRIGIARTALAAIETGSRRVRIEELTQLAEIYQISISEFLSACKSSEAETQLLALTEKQKRVIERLLARTLDPILAKIVRNLYDEPEVQEAIASTLIHLLVLYEEAQRSAHPRPTQEEEGVKA